MANSIFDIFKKGIGPSSSHTVGPMHAARRFLVELGDRKRPRVRRVSAELFGSLALTGQGHGTDRAILLGLAGETPEGVDPDAAEALVGRIRATSTLPLLGRREMRFEVADDLVFHRELSLPGHANGIRFSAWDEAGQLLAEEIFYSTGGGFVAHESELGLPSQAGDCADLPYGFRDATSLFAHGLPLAKLVRHNEGSLRSADEVDRRLDDLWLSMTACAARGMQHEGELPGGLAVRRRAAKLRRDLANPEKSLGEDPMDWVNVWAMAVNEENAAGGHVVTAPTNGAAGVVPAVGKYYLRFVRSATPAGLRDYLLVAGVVGLLYKRNASISGAEVGCQGEVGVACSMAAGGLAAALGCANAQIENAAEIGMEHHLGMTCDPVGGLVQIPCIERNAMGAIKAINAARLALRGDGEHHVRLDQVIRTMRQTGEDMKSSYRETSLGGLAVNVTEC